MSLPCGTGAFACPSAVCTAPGSYRMMSPGSVASSCVELWSGRIAAGFWSCCAMRLFRTREIASWTRLDVMSTIVRVD